MPSFFPSSKSAEAICCGGLSTVELAVSPISSLGGFVGYHTSVLVGGIEFFFTPDGIRGVVADAMLGHKTSSGGSHLSTPMRKVIGNTNLTGRDLVSFLHPHFMSGTYDVLRKNCNSFSDCALYFLCGTRLERRYRAMEKLCPKRLASVLSLRKYVPTEAASGFDVESVIATICGEPLSPNSCRSISRSASSQRSTSGWSRERALDLNFSRASLVACRLMTDTEYFLACLRELVLVVVPPQICVTFRRRTLLFSTVGASMRRSWYAVHRGHSPY